MFQRYTHTGRIAAPLASIWQRGQIGLNKSAVERFGLRQYRYVVLFFDKATASIGLRFSNKKGEAGAKRVTHGPTSSIVSAQSFLHFHGVEDCKTRQVPVRYDTDHDLYVFQLVGKLMQ